MMVRPWTQTKSSRNDMNNGFGNIDTLNLSSMSYRTTEVVSVSMDDKFRYDMFPKPLKQGSKIGIVAPARRVTPEEIQYAIDCLKEYGFEPVFDDRLFAEHHISLETMISVQLCFKNTSTVGKSKPFGLPDVAMAASESSTSWISHSF